MPSPKTAPAAPVHRKQKFFKLAPPGASVDTSEDWPMKPIRNKDNYIAAQYEMDKGFSPTEQGLQALAWKPDLGRTQRALLAGWHVSDMEGRGSVQRRQSLPGRPAGRPGKPEAYRFRK